MKKSILIIGILLLGSCRQAPPPEPTRTPPVKKPTSLPTLAPTYTIAPTPEKARVVPSEGETLFEGPGISILLPSTYVAASKEDIGMIIEELEKMGGTFQQMAEFIRANPDIFLVYSYDTEIGSSGTITSANVTFELLPSGITMQAFLQVLEDLFISMGSSLDETHECTKDGFECVKLELSSINQGGRFATWQFLLKRENFMYALSFTTGSSELEQRKSDFERSFLSLIIE